MNRLPYPLGLILSARAVNRDQERTEYAQRKIGRGIRLVSKRGISYMARTVNGECFPIVAGQRFWR